MDDLFTGGIEIDMGNDTQEVEVVEEITTEDIVDIPDDKKEIEENKEEESSKSEDKQKDLDPEDYVDVDKEDIANTPDDNGQDLVPFVASLVDRGLLPSLDMEELSKLPPKEQEEELMKAYEEQSNNKINDFFKGLPEEVLNMIENYEEGASYKTIIDAHNTNVEYTQISDEELKEDENLMRNILLEDRMMRGMEKDEALEEIDLISDLYKAAKPAKGRIIKSKNNKIEQEKVASAEKQKQLDEQKEQAYNNYKDVVYNTDEIIPGIKLTRAEKDKVFKAGIREKGVTTIDDIYKKDPQKTEAILNYLVDITNGFENWEKINSKAKTAVTRKLQQQIEDSTKKRSSSGSIGNNEKTRSTDNVADRLAAKFKI